MSGADEKKQEIQILLAEYNTLRAEIIQRGSWQIQMWSVAGTVTVALLGFAVAYGAIWQSILLLLFAIGLFAGGILYNDQDIRFIAARVRELELEINTLAGRELLVWEGRGGLAAIGYGERIKKLIKLLSPNSN
jgi:hypothetical protein